MVAPSENRAHECAHDSEEVFLLPTPEVADAVIELGFDPYLGEKSSMESSGDPIQDIRSDRDAHFVFGLANPGFYTLMYGKVRPGHSPEAQSCPARSSAV